MEWPAVRAEVAAAADRVARLLRELPADARPPRVDWTAVEVGAHPAGLAGRYRGMVTQPRSFPASISAENRRELDAVLADGREPAAVADRLLAEVDALLTALHQDGGHTAFYFTFRHTASGIGRIMLTELLLHGMDLAAAAGRPAEPTRTQAVACLTGVLPAIVLAVDPATAVAATGTYHVHLRGDGGGDPLDWTIRAADGAVTVEPGRPDRTDLHLSADPVAFLLNGYGFRSAARVALTGRVVAYGRKPWLAGRLAALFAET